MSTTTTREAPHTVFSTHDRDVLNQAHRVIARRSYVLMAALDHDARERRTWVRGSGLNDDSDPDCEFLSACADLVQDIVDAQHEITKLLEQIDDAKGGA